MSFIVSLSTFLPFILFGLSFFHILNFWTNHDLTLITHLCYFCSCAFKTQLFCFKDFFFSRAFFFLKGLCWCSFQLFFWLSPLTWIGSVGLVSALCQDPDRPSQCVTSMALVQAAPPCEFSWSVAAPWCSIPILCAVKLCESKIYLSRCKSEWGWGRRR